ncbi:MAG: pilus assembly protein [Acidisphaera sp.]|nr:pilus assembly protein [Acidisphaera sp.]
MLSPSPAMPWWRAALTGLAGSAAEFRRARRSSVLIEFAVVVPPLLTMLFGVCDFGNLLIVQRRLALAAAEAAEIATNLAVQPDNTNLLGYNQIYAAGTVIFAYFPSWKTDPTKTFAVTLSSIAMKGVPANCTGSSCTSYTANTAWSVGASQNEPGSSQPYFGWDASQERPCGTIGTSPPTPPANPPANYAGLHSLPAGVFSASSLIVADVSATYVPLFVGFLTGPVTLFRSSYIPPRIGSNAQYVPYSPAGYPVESCPGYP